MTHSNLFIKETWINETEGYSHGCTEWYETFTDNIKDLFKHLQKEYGKASKMFIDCKEGSKQVGWVFSKTEKYTDTKQPYKLSTWVEVSKTEPKQVHSTLNIAPPFK